MNPSRRAALLVAALVAAFAVIAILVVVPHRRAGRDADGGTGIGGPFALTGPDGATVTDASFRGKWMMIYFGYTHCPDACPTALADMASALDLLGDPGRAAIVPLFITVDPERDTPAVMRDYVTGFGASIVGLTGTPDALAEAEAEYKVYAAKHPTGNGGYEMDHSSIIYVMDPRGRFVTNFTHETSPEQMAATLKKLGA